MANVRALVGKKILVTGALGGVGSSITRALHAAGAHVIGLDLKVPYEGNNFDATHAQTPDYFSVDLACARSVERFFAEEFNCVDDLFGVVNTVGVAGPRGPIEELDLTRLSDLFAVNVLSAFHVLHHTVPLLKSKRGGRIVFIGSAAGKMGYQNRSAYSASKWALEGLMRSLSIELGPSKISVNIVAPGPVEGAPIRAAIERLMALEDLDYASALERLTSQSAMGELTEPSSIANAVLFLLLPESSQITGQSISVDAGITNLN